MVPPGRCGCDRHLPDVPGIGKIFRCLHVAAEAGDLDARALSARRFGVLAAVRKHDLKQTCAALLTAEFDTRTR